MSAMLFEDRCWRIMLAKSEFVAMCTIEDFTVWFAKIIRNAVT